jgi:site-specific recombinase XerD
MLPRAREIAREHMTGKHPDDYLFINPLTGRHYTPDALYESFRKYSGVSGVTVHEATRHSFITDVSEQDIPDEQGMLLSGHSSRSSYERYKHVRKRRVSEVVKAYLKNKVISLETRRAAGTKQERESKRPNE